jgi:RNA polymerase sigma-70 factor (ECF subfamily)
VEAPKEIVDWCCIPEPELMNAETRKELDEAIRHLSVGLRTTFLLRDVEGLSGEETAAIMNISVDNVKTRLLRARLKLREELSVYFGERLKHGDQKA